MPATYTALSGRGSAAILALYVKVGACAVAIGADVRRIVIAGELEDGRVAVDALLGADQLVAFAALLELVAFVIAGVLFLRWEISAHRNLPALGDARPRFGVFAGVAAWFVPLLNFVRPLRVVEELWRAGERAAPVPALLRVWWVGWLIALVSVGAVWTLLGAADDVAERQRIDLLRAGATALSALAAGLAIAVVSRVTSRQESRASALGVPRAPRGDGARDRTDLDTGLRVISEHDRRGGPA